MMEIYNQNNLPWELRNLSKCEAFKLWVCFFLRDVLQPSQKLSQELLGDFYYAKAQSKLSA